MISILRSLLLLVLAFDVAASPFHAHLHDLGGGSLVPSVATAQSAATLLQQDDGDDHDVHFASHSLTALRLFAATWPVQGDTPFAPFAGMACVGLTSGAEAALPQVQPVPRRAPPHMRPDGRAPPEFHA